MYNNRLFRSQRQFTFYILTIYIFNCKGPIKCVSLNNQPCKARPTFVNINCDETLFYPFTLSGSKCAGS